MESIKPRKSHQIMLAAVAAMPMSAMATVSYNTVSSTPVAQGQTNGVNNPAETITFEGQGSLNAVIKSAAFSYVDPTEPNSPTTITLDNGPGDTPVTYTDTSTSSGAYLNLASPNFSKADVGVNSPSTAQQTQSALRLEWHWNGTVDGSNDLINDQIGYNQSTGPVSPQQGANRGVSVANPIYVNTNVFNSGTGMLSQNGFNLNASGGLGVYNTYSATNYDQAGNNLLGGTNRVQFSFSDNKLMDYSTSGTATVFATPGSAGYGQGNPALKPASNNLLGIGVNQAREAYQAGSIANMPSTNIDPSTVSTANPSGTAYAAGPWNAAGVNNLSTVPIAANAVLMAANPGTGLSRLNKSDSQWIQTTGRLANGLMFDTVTRDADLGQRPSFATATGIDGTWAVGVNDGGDTTTTAAANLQHTLGSMKYSGKSSDTEVDRTIAQSRMGIGVLALTSTIAQSSYAPLRSLDIDFNDLTDPQLSGGGTDDSKFISANLNTISTAQYQAVLYGYATTVKAPNSAALLAQEQADGYLVGDSNPADATNTSLVSATVQQAEWAKMSSFNVSNPGDSTATGIKGDTTGDVAKFLDNILNSQGSYVGLSTSNDPADAFLNNSYLIPSLLQNIRDPSTGAISSNPEYNAGAFAKATAIYANKFNADVSSSFGKDTETTGASPFYGGAVSGTSPTNFNGAIPITAFNADGSVASDGALAPAGNWLFGNFNQNGVRDLSAVESALAAAKALYNIEPAGTTGANSAFNVSSGIANANNSTPVTYTDINGVSHTMTKGDLIVLGDYQGVARFDGASLVALAEGSAVSDPSGANYSNGTLSGGQANFADAVRNGVLRKNTAMDYMQANTADASYNSSGGALNASAFLRITGHAVLTAPGITLASAVPRSATALNTTDPNSGLELFTYDPTGAHSFDKHDVNADGVVDFNDAVLVDNFNGATTSNLAQQLAATELAPYTGNTQSLDLYSLAQSDGETTIGSSDLTQINSGLTGVGNTNWYGYAISKTGPGTITWNRTGGTVTVYTGAAMQISAGTVHVASAIDPFTDSSATGTDTTKSVAMILTGGTLEYTGGSTSGIQVDRLGTLSISAGAQLLLDPVGSSSNRMLLITGGLILGSGGKIDIGNNDLDVQNGFSFAIFNAIATAYAAGWNSSSGITSSAAAADTTHLTAIGMASGLTSFDGQTVSPTDVLVKYTYFGDSTLDGKVDGSDYSRIDNGYLQHLTGWSNGDFNYDSVIDGSDYTLIDNAYNMQGAAISASIAGPTADVTAEIATATSSVPEPTTAGIIISGAMIGVLSRRRLLRHRFGMSAAAPGETKSGSAGTRVRQGV